MPFGLVSKKKVQEQLEEKQREAARHRAEASAQAERRQKMEYDLRQLQQQEFKRREDERVKEELKQARRKAEEIRRQQQQLAQRERENQRLARLRQTDPEALRRLRDLIRARYKADLYIWGLRSARQGDRPIVVEEGVKADGILNEIYNIVGMWEQDDWTREEWRVASQIKDQLFNSTPRVWRDNPPWGDGR